MKTISLNGAWRLSTAAPAGDICVPASVPGCVHTDLMAAGVIGDPFYRDNVTADAWVYQTDYTYSRSFDAPEDFVRTGTALLECDGLDTLCRITLNGKPVAATGNMFRRYSFDVTGLIKPGENTIRLDFASSANYCREHAGENRGANLSFSLPGSEQLRKAVYQSGWDWAPQLPTAGIWQDIRLCAYEAVKIEDIITRTELSGDMSECRLTVEALCTEFAPGVSLTAALYSPEGALLEEKACPGGKTFFDIKAPALWYPAGAGSQPLYRICVRAEKDGRQLAAREINAGIRRIEVVREKDAWGTSFYFRVNDRPLFAKGADYVPADQFPSRLRKEDYETLLSSAVECHANTIRAWGGAYYEKDVFYDLCDRLGILVWQDFMYACCHYPMTEELKEEYREEARDNIRRLQHHPSIALWCGNNELEMFLAGGSWPSRETNRACREDYRELFYRILKDVCAEEDPGRVYLPASPFDDEGGNPNSETSGDMHYWDVWHGRRPYVAYRTLFPRFMSEFGLQSYPSVEMVRQVSLPGDRQVFSRIMHVMQKDLSGDQDLMFYVGNYFRMPKDLEAFVYASQLVHAEAMKCRAEHWRRNVNGFRCMGVLVWQLNDCAPVISGAAMEYGGRWKALMYYMKDFFAPLLLSLEEEGSSVRAHLSNDTLSAAERRVEIALRDTRGRVLWQTALDAAVGAMSSECIFGKDFSEYLEGEGRYTRFVTARFAGSQKVKTAFFVPYQKLEPERPRIRVVPKDGGLAVTTDLPAFCAYMHVPGKNVRMDANFVTLLPDMEYRAEIRESGGLSAEEIAERLRVYTLRDSYEDFE
ncbi:MAG: glycoside hydrolase family 2 protein [Abditibacteriota bacterium]|nr:glycoside hydrolase family 2 protein [Abditibacteriota bacterium]